MDIFDWFLVSHPALSAVAFVVVGTLGGMSIFLALLHFDVWGKTKRCCNFVRAMLKKLPPQRLPRQLPDFAFGRKKE